ncbi:MAG: hypothetical protein ACRDOE_00595 [Streptosporangiaceae bacterium]
MGLAIDSVGFTRTGGAGGDTVPLASTVAAGDSFTVRAGAAGSLIHLEDIFFAGGLEDVVRVRSPLLHDNVSGLQFTVGESPATRLMPSRYPQTLQSQDTLTLEQLVAVAAAVDVGVLSIYYENLGGSQARLKMPSDVAALISAIKPVKVVLPAGGAASVWLDALITTTENLLDANTDYAVLGYEVDDPTCAVGIKGADTGNLRVVGPGVLTADDTVEYFVKRSEVTGRPHIPIINSANSNNTYVSAFDLASPTGTVVTLVLARLSSPLGA